MSDDDTEEAGRLSEAPSSDRRIGDRHLACFPAHVDIGAGSKRSAVIRDLSVSGALVLTRARVKVGDEIKLSLYLSGDPTQGHEVKGRVVRDERRDIEVSDIWPYAVAIQFDQPFHEIEPDVRALAERQASLGLTK